VKINISEEQKQHFIKMGKLFGYPQCCIDEFLVLDIPRPIRKFNGTGYLPCAKCNEKSEQEMLDIIAKNRTFPLPFPEDSI
jgi:hypothetical protein